MTQDGEMYSFHNGEMTVTLTFAERFYSYKVYQGDASEIDSGSIGYSGQDKESIVKLFRYFETV